MLTMVLLTMAQRMYTLKLWVSLYRNHGSGIVSWERGFGTVELAKNVHWLENMKGSYVYLVLGQEPVLIDTGMPNKGTQLEQELGKLGVKLGDIAHVLLTHHDVDHIGNAKWLQDRSEAKLWAPELDLPYIHGTAKRPGIKRVIGALVRASSPKVESIYKPGQKIGDLEVIETPGHTPGHVSILYNDILFAGDLVMSKAGKLRPSPKLMTWDSSQLRQSLNKLANYSFDWVCPAHGGPVEHGSFKNL